MFIKDIPEELPVLLDANVPVELGSSPGAGKSESIDQLTETLSKRDGFEWGLNKTFIATLSPVDLLGFMVPGYIDITSDTGKVEKVRISEFTMPPWMISTKGRPMNEYKRGIIVFEEWDKGEPDVKKGSAEILLNGQAGRHKVHPGIARIALVNRTMDRSGSTKNFDFIINRREELTLYADVGGWQRWADAAGVDPLFVAFAVKYPEVVFKNEVPDKQGPFCTPRSLVKLSQVLPKRLDERGRMKNDVMAGEHAGGMIGTAAAMQLMAWIKLRHETPDFEDIVKDPDGCALPDKPDARLMICFECAHKVDGKTIGKVARYIKRMSAEFAVTFMQSAVRRDHTLINNSAVLEWVGKNASLMNAIGGAR
jgi:hypothetical protein